MKRKYVYIPTYGMIVDELNADERYILSKCITYLVRHLTRYSNIEKEALKLICWVLCENTQVLTDFFMVVNEEKYGSLAAELMTADADPEEYGRIFEAAYRDLDGRSKYRFKEHILGLLEQQKKTIFYRSRSSAERIVSSIARMFDMTAAEQELFVFFFIIKTYSEPEAYFDFHLDCFKYKGRKFLLNMLALNASQFQQSVTRLKDFGIVQVGMHEIDISYEFLQFVQHPNNKTLAHHFFIKAPKSALPLSAHFLPEKKIEHVRRLLKHKRERPSHLLLYGPPGTGKTSLARRLGQELGLVTYEIARYENNKAESRRAAIIACINMTNAGKGSLIIVDEADNLINTDTPWLFGGETHDKGWLNHLLEISGTRIIWITNNVDAIDPSVLRRFSFSLGFKPLNQRQRQQVWDRILRRNRIKRHFDSRLMSKYAANYKVSAGVIDMAVKNAIDAGAMSKEALIDAIEIGINAHEVLLQGGFAKKSEKRVSVSFTLNGLNVRADMHRIIDQVKRFNNYLGSCDTDLHHQMSLLFYGPPGTGKSELARYMGADLHRELIFKRFSELQSKWVGEGEKNIRAAFEEAENENAILVVDEIDSVLFCRSRAQRSWEISFTNEFLTAMERFRSLLICTTNRLDDLDAAAIRRFSFKLAFDYLTPEGNRIFFHKMLEPLSQKSLTKSESDRLRRLENLAPGDFKTVQNQFRFYAVPEIDNSRLIDALAEEARIKRRDSPQRRIGF
jgi:transitional endoplasmic reticulum ATPase